MFVFKLFLFTYSLLTVQFCVCVFIYTPSCLYDCLSFLRRSKADYGLTAEVTIQSEWCPRLLFCLTSPFDALPKIHIHANALV